MCRLEPCVWWIPLCVDLKDISLFVEIKLFKVIILPNRTGKVMAAGPGPANSAAMGPLL